LLKQAKWNWWSALRHLIFEVSLRILTKKIMKSIGRPLF